MNLLDEEPVRFTNLIHGWRLHLFSSNPDTKEGDVEQWEFQMTERLPWQSERKALRVDDIQADREAFEALDHIETH